MNLRNRVQLIGNLGMMPQVREFDNGRKLARFTLATTDVYKKDGKYVRETQWHTVVAWNKTVDLLLDREVTIGSEVIVLGSVITNQFVDKNGKPRVVSEITADSIIVRRLHRAEQKLEKNIA